jgi:hypothetical protein
MRPPLSKPQETSTPCYVCILFIFAGLGFLAFFIYQAYRDYRVFARYVQGECRILDKRLGESSDSDGTTYRAEFDYEIMVNDQPHRAHDLDTWGAYGSHDDAQADIRRFLVGETYPCWYDPADPRQAVLTRRVSWFHLFGLIPLLFLGLGLGELIHTLRKRGASA